MAGGRLSGKFAGAHSRMHLQLLSVAIHTITTFEQEEEDEYECEEEDEDEEELTWISTVYLLPREHAPPIFETSITCNLRTRRRTRTAVRLMIATIVRMVLTRAFLWKLAPAHGARVQLSDHQPLSSSPFHCTDDTLFLHKQRQCKYVRSLWTRRW